MGTQLDMMQMLSNPEFLKGLAEYMASKTADKPTFRDLWGKYEAYGSSRTDGGRTRLKGWRINATLGKVLLPFFGDLPWDQVDLAKAEEYRQMRSGQRGQRHGRLIKAATRNRELRTAQACLSYAVKRGLIPRNPMAGLCDEPTVHDRDFALSQEQVAAICKAAPPLLRWFLLVLNETGMRRGELRTLEWTEVDLDRGIVTVLAHKAKNGHKRDFPLSVNARAILEMMPRDNVNTYVFPSPHQVGQPIAEGTLTDWWSETRARSGVRGPKGQPIWLHSLRHTFATDMATAGMPLEVLMSMCGWTTERMARRYINLTPEHRAAAKPIMDARGETIRGAVLGSAIKRPKRAPAPAPEPSVTQEEIEAMAVADEVA